MRAVERVSKNCGGTRFHRHRQWSGRVDRCGDVSPEAPEYSRPHPHQRPRTAVRQAAPEQGLSAAAGTPSSTCTAPAGSCSSGIQLHRGITVDHIDLANREVVTAAGRRYAYWHLVLASGATPVPLAVPGGEAALSLRSFADAVVLRMAAKNADSAVVVGGGLIGCEAASSLATRGVATTLVAPEPVPCAPQVRRRGRRARGEDVVRHRRSLHRVGERGRRRGPHSHPGHRRSR